MNRKFPGACWFVLGAINVQCFYFYLLPILPHLDAKSTLGRPAFRIGTLEAVIFALALAEFPGTSADRFAHYVFVLAAVDGILITLLSEFSAPLGLRQVLVPLILVAAAVQVVSALLLRWKVRGRI